MADNFQVFEEEKPDHHYRTEIPNIVELLGLSPVDLAIYFKLKRPAGDDGMCTRSITKMAKELNVCENSVRNSIKKMREPFKLLGGKPLIRSRERKKSDKSNETNIVTIVNIWRENGDYFRAQEKKNKDKQTQIPPSPDEGDGLHQMKGGASSDEGKEEPFKKSKKSKKTTTSSSSTTDEKLKTEILLKASINTKTLKRSLKYSITDIKTALHNLSLKEDVENQSGYFFDQLKNIHLYGKKEDKVAVSKELEKKNVDMRFFFTNIKSQLPAWKPSGFQFTLGDKGLLFKTSTTHYTSVYYTNKTILSQVESFFRKCDFSQDIMNLFSVQALDQRRVL